MFCITYSSSEPVGPGVEVGSTNGLVLGEVVVVRVVVVRVVVGLNPQL